MIRPVRGTAVKRPLHPARTRIRVSITGTILLPKWWVIPMGPKRVALYWQSVAPATLHRKDRCAGRGLSPLLLGKREKNHGWDPRTEFYTTLLRSPRCPSSIVIPGHDAGRNSTLPHCHRSHEKRDGIHARHRPGLDEGRHAIGLDSTAATARHVLPGAGACATPHLGAAEGAPNPRNSAIRESTHWCSRGLRRRTSPTRRWPSLHG